MQPFDKIPVQLIKRGPDDGLEPNIRRLGCHQ
jgi:hypothetical protein